MSTLSIPLRLGLEPDALDKTIKQLLAKLRVALPCIVQSFDPETQTVSVLPAVMERVVPIIAGVPTPQDFPFTKPFGKIPVVFPKCGNTVLTMPVTAGDECLVIFADYCTDGWCQNGGINNSQWELRRHDMSDGFAIIGPWSQPNLIPDYNTSAAELRTIDGSVKISLGESGIVITGPITFNGAVSMGSTLTVTGNADLNGVDNLINGYTKP